MKYSTFTCFANKYRGKKNKIWGIWTLENSQMVVKDSCLMHLKIIDFPLRLEKTVFRRF